MRYLGSIDIYEDEGDTIRLSPDTKVDQRYNDLEANGQNFPEALSNLLEQIEGLPE
jgi:hypothetical protein